MALAAPAPQVPKPRYQLRDLVGRLQWTGDAVQAQRAQRDSWLLKLAASDDRFSALPF